MMLTAQELKEYTVKGQAARIAKKVNQLLEQNIMPSMKRCATHGFSLYVAHIDTNLLIAPTAKALQAAGYDVQIKGKALFISWA